MTLNQSSEEFVRKVLRSLGLTEVQSTVYTLLAKHGPLKGGETARDLDMQKAQVYHALKILQSKGWVQPTLEFPARFTAIPLAEIIDSQAKLKREEAYLISSTKKDILHHWSFLNPNKDRLAPEKFVVIEGRNKIYAKIFQMIEDANNEIKTIASGHTLQRIVNAGAGPVVFKKLRQRQIRIRVLAQASRDNAEVLNQGIEGFTRQGLENRVEVRYLTDSSFYCRLAVKDNQEAILFLTPRSTPAPTKDQEETALWINSAAVTSVFNAFFDKLWPDARDSPV